MKVLKIVKWIILIPIILFFVIWIGTLAKNRIVTELHRDDVENLDLLLDYGEPLEYDWYRILSYSETEIEICFVKKVYSSFRDYELGGIVTYYHHDSDGKWHYSWSNNYLWSTAGSADNYIWPYWHHVFTKGRIS